VKKSEEGKSFTVLLKLYNKMWEMRLAMNKIAKKGAKRIV